MFQVFAGSQNLNGQGDLYDISKIVVRPDILLPITYPDIALVKVTVPIKFSEKIQPILVETEKPKNAQVGVSCGWGEVAKDGPKPSELNCVNITINEYVCIIDEDSFCALGSHGTGICTYDNGGPLVRNGKIIGIAGPLNHISCRYGLPEVYVMASFYAEWINEIIVEK